MDEQQQLAAKKQEQEQIALPSAPLTIKRGQKIVALTEVTEEKNCFRYLTPALTPMQVRKIVLSAINLAGSQQKQTIFISPSLPSAILGELMKLSSKPALQVSMMDFGDEIEGLDGRVSFSKLPPNGKVLLVCEKHLMPTQSAPGFLVKKLIPHAYSITTTPSLQASPQIDESVPEQKASALIAIDEESSKQPIVAVSKNKLNYYFTESLKPQKILELLDSFKSLPEIKRSHVYVSKKIPEDMRNEILQMRGIPRIAGMDFGTPREKFADQEKFVSRVDFSQLPSSNEVLLAYDHRLFATTDAPQSLIDRLNCPVPYIEIPLGFKSEILHETLAKSQGYNFFLALNITADSAIESINIITTYNGNKRGNHFVGFGSGLSEDLCVQTAKKIPQNANILVLSTNDHDKDEAIAEWLVVNIPNNFTLEAAGVSPPTLKKYAYNLRDLASKSRQKALLKAKSTRTTIGRRTTSSSHGYSLSALLAASQADTTSQLSQSSKPATNDQESLQSSVVRQEDKAEAPAIYGLSIFLPVGLEDSNDASNVPPAMSSTWAGHFAQSSAALTSSKDGATQEDAVAEEHRDVLRGGENIEEEDYEIWKLKTEETEGDPSSNKPF